MNIKTKISICLVGTIFTLCETNRIVAQAEDQVVGASNTRPTGYVTLKMSADGLRGDLVDPKDVRDKRIADLEKRMAKLEAEVRTLKKDVR